MLLPRPGTEGQAGRQARPGGSNLQTWQLGPTERKPLAIVILGGSGDARIQVSQLPQCYQIPSASPCPPPCELPAVLQLPDALRPGGEGQGGQRTFTRTPGSWSELLGGVPNTAGSCSSSPGPQSSEIPLLSDLREGSREMTWHQPSSALQAANSECTSDHAHSRLHSTVPSAGDKSLLALLG